MRARFLATAKAGAILTSNGPKNKKNAASAKLVSGPTVAIKNSAADFGDSAATWDTPRKMNTSFSLAGGCGPEAEHLF